MSLDGEELLRECVILVEVEGAPTDRLRILLREMLADPAKVLAYLALLLGDLGAEDLLRRSADLPDGDKSPGSAGGPGFDDLVLLEPLLRAAARDDDALERVQRLLEDLRGDDGSPPPLGQKVDRIDVVYICSNGQIARQNLPKLRVGGDGERHVADRLTMLASQLSHLEGRKLNFVSFTPSTSFNLRSNGGKAEERVLLYRLVKMADPAVRPGPWTHFFRCSAKHEGFKRKVQEHDDSTIVPELAEEFAVILREPGTAGMSLLDEVSACVDEFRRAGRVSGELSSRRYALIGRLRRALARAAVKRLEPDLVIMDEFQRFKDLMSDDGEGAELARELFDHADCRLLLLSATPFKMYTLPEEPEGDDHYDDFIDTVRFLAGADGAAQVRTHLARLRAALFAGDLEKAQVERDGAERLLRRVMCRTERLATTPDRDGFVSERSWDHAALAPDDVRDFRRLSQVSRVVGGQDLLEFWRSSPYVLELMEQYKVKEKLLHHDPADPSLVAAMQTDGGQRLAWEEIRRYAAIDPGNAKMRGLVSDVLDRGAWQLVWIPPSLPYYELDGPYADPELTSFTKRLIFSSWAVAPKAISTVVRYVVACVCFSTPCRPGPIQARSTSGGTGPPAPCWTVGRTPT